jgi:hypothetical protein
MMAVFWVVVPYSLIEVYRRFIALMMEAVSTSETSVNFYQTTRRYNPEDSYLHSRRHENLKSYSPLMFVWFPGVQSEGARMQRVQDVLGLSWC